MFNKAEIKVVNFNLLETVAQGGGEFGGDDEDLGS